MSKDGTKIRVSKDTLKGLKHLKAELDTASYDEAIQFLLLGNEVMVNPYLSEVLAPDQTLEDYVLTVRNLANKIMIKEKAEGVYLDELMELLTDTAIVIKRMMEDKPGGYR